MTAHMNGRFSGFTDSISSKIMRTNRSALLPSLMLMQRNQNDRTDMLHGRLEELLVFEILKEGGTSYRQFTVRSLYKHVMQAIKKESQKEDKAGTKLMDQLALGRAIVGGLTSKVVDSSMRSIDEKAEISEASMYPLQVNDSKEEEEKGGKPHDQHVTWRERLGGYLHPRDMRKLVTPFSASNEPELIVRRHAMLLNFDPLRTIILRDRLIVLVPDGADSILVQLEKRIRGDPNQLSEYQHSGMSESESTPSLNKQDNTNVSDDGGSDQNSQVGTEEDKLLSQNSFMETEWAELEGKEWIDLPFELQSVDAVLSSVSSILAEDVLDLQLEANAIIMELVQPNSDVGDHAQEALRTMKNAVREMTSRVDGFNRAIDTLLEDYEDMALMNLSRLLTHPERFVQPVPAAVLEEESDEPELILEAHLQRGHTLVNALTLVEGQISSTEDFAARKSDSIRNRLLYINMVISILSLSVAAGSFVGSIFGMNVVNSYEESDNAFVVIAWTTVAGIFSFLVLILFALRRSGTLPNFF